VQLAAALALPDAAAPSPARAKALAGAAWLATWQGDLEAAKALSHEALARPLVDRRPVALALSVLANVALDQGDFAHSEEFGREALAAYRELGNDLGAASTLDLLGCAASARGEEALAAARFEEGLALARPLGETRRLAMLLGDYAFLAMVRGDLRRATDLYEESLARGRRVGDRFQVGWYLEGMAGVAAALDRPERAARLFGAAAAVRDAFGVPVRPPVRPIHERLLAPVRAALGEAGFAAAVAEGRALTVEEGIGEAVATAEAIRRPGPPPGTASAVRASPSSLTSREREVLRLLVAGKSNPAIGEALFISPRTAQTHVTSILAKLGVTTRAEAAALAVRDGLV
jgi:non-specific serine/threonine protein kinase